jgi:hypothetical protein
LNTGSVFRAFDFEVLSDFIIFLKELVNPLFKILVQVLEVSIVQTDVREFMLEI